MGAKLLYRKQLPKDSVLLGILAARRPNKIAELLVKQNLDNHRNLLDSATHLA